MGYRIFVFLGPILKKQKMTPDVFLTYWFDFWFGTFLGPRRTQSYGGIWGGEVGWWGLHLCLLLSTVSE